MERANTLDLGAAINLLPRRPALLIGTGATIAAGALEHAIRGASDSVKVSRPLDANNTFNDYPSLIDALRAEDPAKAQKLENAIRTRLRQLPPSVELQHLARAGWSACISLTQDLLFEGALRDYLDSIPSSRTVTIVDHPKVQPPQRTVPIYKLFGNLDNSEEGHNLVLAGSDVTLRQQYWPMLLKTLPDHVRDAPMFCIGTASSTAFVQKVLGTLLAMPKPSVASVMLLRYDPILKDPTVRALLQHFKWHEVDASLKEFCGAVADLKPAQRALELGFSNSDPRRRFIELFERYSAIVSVVPTSLPQHFEPAKHMNSLVDALFRPTSIDWAPYLCSLDLRRTVSVELKAAAERALDNSRPRALQNIVVLGEAGVGKTTLTKRVACDLTADGVIVLWCRRTLSGNWLRQFRELANELSQQSRKNESGQHRFLIVCDDPWALRMDANELMNCFDRFSGILAFLFCFRNSDYFTSDSPASSSPPPPTQEIEVPYELNAEELESLASMLVKIGASPNVTAATSAVSNVPSPHAKDILCSLWYLVPETKGQLTQSLEDQYRRLDVASESISSLAHHAATASHVARRAYELVTVTSNLNIDLPVEIVVRALHIDYSEWLDMASNGRPLWGLLYDAKNEDETTIVYRTRNEVVTQVLLDLVNGGVGHAGEFRILKELLAACDGGSPVYRNFVMDVLVRGRYKLAKILSYEQGIELFDIAEKALPYQDRVLVHHKGIWMTQVGREHRSAYSQFEKALEAATYPGADRDAPAEHIHTSMAAAVAQLVKSGSQERETGVELVRGHLRQANSPTFFNPHTSHVVASLLFDLAKQGGVIQQDKISLGAMCEALEEIERAMQMIGAHGRSLFRYTKDIHMLDDLKAEMVGSMPDLSLMKDTASDMYSNTRSQAGFEAVSRRMLADAAIQAKGKSFNSVQDYLLECARAIDEQGQELSVEMRAVRVDLLIRWRIQRPSGAIDWAQLRQDLEKILATNKYRESLVRKFYLGVALFHLADVGSANATFAELRRSVSPALRPNDLRCLFLGKEGRARRVQCTIEKGQGRFYATVPELCIDIPVRSPPSDAGPGATTHCYVGFSFNGATALFDRPDENDLLLP
jgi:hypothetical protein